MSSDSLFRTKDHWNKGESDIFRELLLSDFGISEYASFHKTGEGKELPTGIESFSAAILTKDGLVKTYNIEWDLNRENPDGGNGYYILVPESSWSESDFGSVMTSSEYISARVKLGLPITAEQQKILDTK